MTAPGAADLLREVGLLADGPVPGAARSAARRPGVYLVELPARRPTARRSTSRSSGSGSSGRPTCSSTAPGPRRRRSSPASPATGCRARPCSSSARPAESHGRPGGALQATPPGDPLPCPDGLRLHLLRGIESTPGLVGGDGRARRSTRTRCSTRSRPALDPATIAILGGFVRPLRRAPPADRRGAPDRHHRRPHGRARPRPAPPPTRVVELPSGGGRAPGRRPGPAGGRPGRRRPPRDPCRPAAGPPPGRRPPPPTPRRVSTGTRLRRRTGRDRGRESAGEEALHLSREGSPASRRSSTSCAWCGGPRSSAVSRPRASTAT